MMWDLQLMINEIIKLVSTIDLGHVASGMVDPTK